MYVKYQQYKYLNKKIVNIVKNKINISIIKIK